MKKTAYIVVCLLLLLLLPMFSPTIVYVAYATQLNSMFNTVINEIVVNNETFREVIVSGRLGRYSGSASVRIPVAVLEQALGNTSTMSSYTMQSGGFEEELWGGLWFCLPPGSPEYAVKYPQPNNFIRYYPLQFNLPWIIPDENYPVNETFHPEYLFIHLSPGMVDDLDNYIYAFAFGGIIVGGVAGAAGASGLVHPGAILLFMALLALALELLGCGMRWFKDNVVKTYYNDGFTYAKNIRKSVGGYLISWIQLDWEESFGAWRDTWFSFSIRYDVPTPRSLWWGGPAGGVAGKFLRLINSPL